MRFLFPPRLIEPPKVKPERARYPSDVLPPRLPTFREKKPISLAEYLMAGPSKFGGTNLERLADNAAKELGFEFDAAQQVVHLTSTGYYTVIDRILYSPPTAVYIDGIQHFMRLDNEQQDMIQVTELRDLGFRVFRLSYQDLLRDPLGTVRQVLYGVG
jgi:hypothetical protein